MAILPLIAFALWNGQIDRIQQQLEIAEQISHSPKLYRPALEAIESGDVQKFLRQCDQSFKIASFRWIWPGHEAPKRVTVSINGHPFERLVHPIDPRHPTKSDLKMVKEAMSHLAGVSPFTFNFERLKSQYLELVDMPFFGVSAHIASNYNMGVEVIPKRTKRFIKSITYTIR